MLRGLKMRSVKVQCVDETKKAKIVAAVLEHKLDRRKAYCVGMFGELATVEVVTVNCSGCACDCGDGYPCGHGNSGCERCGYTKKRRDSFPEPVRVSSGYIQIDPATCSNCGISQEHFDSGCKACAELVAAGNVQSVPDNEWEV